MRAGTSKSLISLVTKVSFLGLADYFDLLRLTLLSKTFFQNCKPYAIFVE